MRDVYWPQRLSAVSTPKLRGFERREEGGYSTTREMFDL